MIIHEPATLLTDYLLALLGGFLAWRLHRHPSICNPATRWWFRALVVLALSAFIGGSYHGFAPNLPSLADEFWWRVVLWIICLLGFTMGSAFVCELVPTRCQPAWNRFLIGKLLVASVAVMLVPQFVVAVADYGVVMLSWAIAALVVRRPWCGWIFAGVTLSVIAAWIQQSGVSWWEHLNHNDVFHLVQALALFGFYLGARLMRGSSARDQADAPMSPRRGDHLAVLHLSGTVESGDGGLLDRAFGADGETDELEQVHGDGADHAK